MSNSGESQEKKIVERYIELYNSLNVEEMVNLFTDDCVFQSFNGSKEPVECNGKEDLFKTASLNASYFESRKLTIKKWVFSDEKVAIEIDSQASVLPNAPEEIKKGDSLNIKGISIFEFTEGKIKRLVDYSLD